MGCAVGEDAFIGSLDMGMGADYGGDGAIEMEAHGDAFTGGLGVEVEEDHVDSVLLEACDFIFYDREGVFEWGIHEGAALGFDDGYFSMWGIECD